jgi:tetratricopeptide (TPR) repeat protein
LRSIGAIKEGTPSSVEYTSLGLCLSMLKDQEGAEEALKKALKANPDNLNAHWGMGRLLDIKGDREGALFHYRSALILYPESKTIKDKIRELIVETK